MAHVDDSQSRLHGSKLSDAIKAEHVEALSRDNDAHAHSHAAHLETEGKVHTIPEGKGKQGREPGTVNQPPQDPKRSDKACVRQ